MEKRNGRNSWLLRGCEGVKLGILLVCELTIINPRNKTIFKVFKLSEKKIIPTNLGIWKIKFSHFFI